MKNVNFEIVLGRIPEKDLLKELAERQKSSDKPSFTFESVVTGLKNAFEKKDAIDFEYQLAKLRCFEQAA